MDDLKNIELDTLPVYDDRYKINKIRMYGDKVYTNICGLDVPEDSVECESFTVISIYSLRVYEDNCYPQVYLDNFAYKIVDKQMIDYLDDDLFDTDDDYADYGCIIHDISKSEAICLLENCVLDDLGCV